MLPKTRTINAHLADIIYPPDGHFIERNIKNTDVKFSLKHRCVLFETNTKSAAACSV
jgi:hypothetical protein